MERMIRKLFLISACFLFLSIPTYSQGASIRQVTVTDKVTKETLPGVQVIVKGTFKGGVSDID